MHFRPFLGFLCFVGSLSASVDGLGVNWGTQATHRFPETTVAQLLKDNGITKVKIFEAEYSTMSALAGTGIEVMVAIPNNMLEMVAGDYNVAKQWVKQNVSRYDFNGGVTIKGTEGGHLKNLRFQHLEDHPSRKIEVVGSLPKFWDSLPNPEWYVAVGNEPFLSAYNHSFDNVTFPALKNIQAALGDAGLADNIKVTVPLNADVYSGDIPSAGKFRSDIKDIMVQIVQLLNSTGGPFTVNIYPFISLYQNENFPKSYAYFEGTDSPVNDPTSGISYTNVFDANFDTLVWALKDIGYPNLPIIVGEVGWPTDGDKNANVVNAKRFYDGLLKKLANKVGTPQRPGYIEVYLFGLIDEDGKSIAPGGFERHWGIFSYDGTPKFTMDLSGADPSKSLVGAKNVKYLQQQWCVLKPDANLSAIPSNIDWACTYSDCTALGYGSSCGNLDAQGNASFAFNMYYQVQSQVDGSCDFQGLAIVTPQNASTNGCSFMIQILSSSATRTAMWSSFMTAVILLLQPILF